MKERSGPTPEEINKRRRAKLPDESPLALQRKNIALGEQLTEANTRSEQAIGLAEQALEVAVIDGMTGIPNRRGFEDKVRQAYENISETRRGPDPVQRALILVIGDIDKFKSINDTYGHKAGDVVIQKIAECLAKNLREGDVVGRLGGEEFGIAISNGPNIPALAIAEKLRMAVQQLEILSDGKRIPVTMSFGVADTERANTYDEALSEADKALYAAKNGGRNRIALASKLPSTQ